jgi:hypothetical protein
VALTEQDLILNIIVQVGYEVTVVSDEGKGLMITVVSEFFDEVSGRLLNLC